MYRIIMDFRKNKGTVLMMGVMVMMLLAVMGLGYLALTSSNLIRARRDLNRATAFYLAEAGLEYVIADIISQGGATVGRTYDTSAILGSLNAGATGTVSITAGPSSGYATVTSRASYRGINEAVRIVISAKNLGVWNNAIFAGIGQTGRGINGNVNIRGSVHILGEGEPFTDLNGNGVRDGAEPYTDSNRNGRYDPGEPFTDTDGNGVWSDAEPYQDINMNGVYDPPLTATDLAGDLSGTAYIGNNYQGMPSELFNKVPPLVPKLVNGEMVQTLGAEVRVKHGRVNLSGNAKIGDSNVAGNQYKETVDGVYVTDGFGGNKGASNIYSDNGTNQRYDLGDRVAFPNLSDRYTDPGTRITYNTYEDYMVANSLSIPINRIDEDVSSFSYSGGANSIAWNKNTRTLTISGIIRISGNLNLGSKNITVNYDGVGTLFVQGSINVRGNVMPVGTFVTDDSLGCIAKYDINFATEGGESQLCAAGAWYAQRTIRSAKQSQFAGTYVANYFDMGSQVPSIYQVPLLADNLPPGMPGRQNSTATQIVSWKHVRPGTQ